MPAEWTDETAQKERAGSEPPDHWASWPPPCWNGCRALHLTLPCHASPPHPQLSALLLHLHPGLKTVKGSLTSHHTELLSSFIAENVHVRVLILLSKKYENFLHDISCTFSTTAEKTQRPKATVTQMFTAALLTTAERWKPNCSSMDEWINKTWFHHTLNYFLFSHEEWSTDTWNTDELWKHYAKVKEGKQRRPHIVMIPFIWNIQNR